MVKRIAPTVLITASLLSVSISPQAFASSTASVSAGYLKSLPKKMSQLIPKSTDTIIFTSTGISGDQVTGIDGEVNTENGSTPFELSGQLYKSVRTGGVDGDLIDKTDNFEIMHFGINTPVTAQQTALRFVKKNTDVTSDLLSMYLRNRKTGEITLLEAPTDQILSGTDFATSTTAASSFTTESPELGLWFERYFQPDSVTKSDSSPNKSTKIMNVPGKTGAIVPMYMNDWSNYHSYTSQFKNPNGTPVSDEIAVEEEVQYPSTVSNSTNTYQSLTVVGTSYNDNGYIYANSYTGWRIGGAGPVSLKMQIGPSGAQQEILQQNETGMIESGQRLNVKLNIGYTVKYGIFSASFSFVNSMSGNLNQNAQSFPSGTMQAGAQMPTGDYLSHYNDYYEVTYSTANKSSSSGSATDYFAWNYNVYNYLDQANWGSGIDSEQVAQYLS